MKNKLKLIEKKKIKTMKVIFAQGNPGEEYSQTRHNIGFYILDSFVGNLKLKWVNKPKLQAKLAKTSLNGSEVLFIKPDTFYNQTGSSIQKIINFYKLDQEQDLLVIHDDIDLPFGTIRTRQQGSDAGNKGLKSIINQIGPTFYRIRVGTSNELRSKIDEADFVLRHFTKDEQDKLVADIIPHSIELIKQFTEDNLKIDSQKL